MIMSSKHSAEALGYVLEKLDWMRAERIWPNGLRYLWTDAFGVVNYVSLFRETGDEKWLEAAEALVADVYRVPVPGRTKAEWTWRTRSMPCWR